MGKTRPDPVIQWVKKWVLFPTRTALAPYQRVPSGYVNSLLLNMAIEIVSFPMENGDFPVRYVNVYQRVRSWLVVLTCAITILKNDGVRQWEGLCIPYMK